MAVIPPEDEAAGYHLNRLRLTGGRLSVGSGGGLIHFADWVWQVDAGRLGTEAHGAACALDQVHVEALGVSGDDHPRVLDGLWTLIDS